MIEELCRVPLRLKGDNFTPATRTPWGGTLIAKTLKGIPEERLVGESWELSDHPSFPNQVEAEGISCSLRDLAATQATALYGKKHKQLPFLAKFLNTGSWLPHKAELEKLGLSKALQGKNNGEIHEILSSLEDTNGEIHRIHRALLDKNLSIQVHPKKGLFENLPSKAEAWLILDAEPGAGIYLGLKKGVTKDEFELCMRQGKDLSTLLNFVEVKKGDLFFIAPGTLHAIGAGLLLYEPQESSETTFRAYDWGRPRPLHIEEALKSTNFNAPQGEECLEVCRRTAFFLKNGTVSQELLVDAPEFQLDRLTFSHPGATFEGDTEGREILGITILEGTLAVKVPGMQPSLFQKGESLLLPACLGSYSLSSPVERTVALSIRSN